MVVQPIGSNERNTAAAAEPTARGGPLLYIGDSLGVGTVPELKKIAGYAITDRVKQSEPSAWGESQLDTALTAKHFAVVFDMGSNDGNAPGAFIDRLDRIKKKIGGRTLIIATLNGPAAPMNDEIRGWARSNAAQVNLVEWAGKVSGGDGIHGNYPQRAGMFHQAIPRPGAAPVLGTATTTTTATTGGGFPRARASPSKASPSARRSARGWTGSSPRPPASAHRRT